MSLENGLSSKNNKFKKENFTACIFYCVQSFIGSVKIKNLKIYSGWLSMQTFKNKLKVCAVVKTF